jgi:ribonucleotide reductase beta subunit family protein with ferritin-like domain
MLKDKPSATKIATIIKDAVTCEKEFVCDALKVELVGMKSGLMSEYIEYVADRLLVALGQRPVYNTKNPFKWMVNLGLNRKNNFFEGRTSEYRKAGVGRSGARVFNTNAAI